MYGIITKLLFLREALKPYVLDQMRLAAERGTLAMRPLWFDDPGDEIAWTMDDELAVGPDHRRGADRGARRALAASICRDGRAGGTPSPARTTLAVNGTTSMRRSTTYRSSSGPARIRPSDSHVHFAFV